MTPAVEATAGAAGFDVEPVTPSEDGRASAAIYAVMAGATTLGVLVGAAHAPETRWRFYLLADVQMLAA